MSKNLQSSPNLYLLGYHQIPPWLSSKRLQRTHVGVDVEKREPLYTVGGNVYWYSHCFFKKLQRYFKKTKNRTTITTRNSTPGYLFEKKMNH